MRHDPAAGGARRGSPRAGDAAIAAVGSLAGWVLVSVGVGVGAPRWAQGLPVAGTGAAIALACGIALLVIAVVGLVRATRGWGRLIIGPWLVIVLVFTFSLSIALAAVVPPRPSLDAPTPAGAEVVAMLTVDGVTLEGWYFPTRNGAAVVVRHGAGSTRADALEHAEVLVGAGYGVLITDARGHGGSAGRGMDLGWYGELDTRAAVDYLIGRVEVDPARIAVLGLSMGGEEAIGAAADDERIRAVVAEGATGRTAEDKQWLSDEYGAAGVVQEQLDLLTYGFVDAMTAVAPPMSLSSAIAATEPTPFLLIAAGEVVDEQLVADRLRRVAPDRVDVWVVPGAGHVGAISAGPLEWGARVVLFLDEALADDAAR